jgi:lysophospholipase L1-like esterase
MKILFQGDSITDAGRGRDDPHKLGEGYPKFAAENIRNAYPNREFEFINLGISGNRAENLRERWQSDCIDINPDIVSILIGVNDTWHRSGDRNWMPHEYFEECYRDILTQIKEKTHAKIIMMEQFLLYTEDKAFFRVDLDPKIQITRKLAREFADAFIPLDGLFAAASVGCPPTAWAADGVHPTQAGAHFIGLHYLEAVKKLI